MIDFSPTEAAIVILIIVSVFSIITVILFGLYIKRLKRKRLNKSFLKSKTKIRFEDYDFPMSVQSDGVLPVSSTLFGVITLELYARKKKPDYLIGINRGGWLLSTYLAHRLNIDRKKLLRFDSKRKAIIDNNIDHSNLNYKSILLVDDISRKGDSIKIAHEYMKEKFPDGTSSTVVLVICGENEAKHCIDFYPYCTEYIDIQLPWSDDKRKQEARENLAKSDQGKVVNKVINLDDPDSLELKSRILRMAGENTLEGMDISTDDIDTFLEFISTR